MCNHGKAGNTYVNLLCPLIKEHFTTHATRIFFLFDITFLNICKMQVKKLNIAYIVKFKHKHFMSFIPRQFLPHAHKSTSSTHSSPIFFIFFFIFSYFLFYLEAAPFYSDMEFHSHSGTLLLFYIHTVEIRNKPNIMLVWLSGTPLLTSGSDGLFN